MSYLTIGSACLAGDGDDVLTRSDENDFLVGNTGQDRTCEQAGNDTVYGQDGDDRFYGNDATTTDMAGMPKILSKEASLTDASMASSATASA